MEGALKSRQATVDAAVRAPGATADSVVATIISESHAVESATENMSGSGAAGGVAEAQPMASAKTMQDALQSPNFRLLATSLEAFTTHTGADRRRVLLATASSGCAIALRVLVFGTVSIARMHPALGKVLESRQEAPAYFGEVLTVDRQTLVVPARLSEWTWAGKQGTDPIMMNKFMSLELQSLEWFNGGTGINSINAARLGPHFTPAVTPPLDVYTTIHGVEQLCEFLHRLLCAIGAPDVVDELIGFTMLTFCTFYTAHLKCSFALATLEEQVSWLDDAALQFHLALGVIQIQLRQFILSTQPDLAEMVCVLPIDCPPPEHLRRKEANLALLQRNLDATSWIKPSKVDGRPAQAVTLPLLSDHPGLVRWFVPLTAGPAKKGGPPGGPSGKLKRKGGADAGDTAPEPAAVTAEPGSLYHTWVWLAQNKSLLMGNTVWDVAKIATDLKLGSASAFAWPMLLSGRKGGNLLALLKAGDPKAAAFKPIASVTPTDAAFRAKYSRIGTEAERSKLPPTPAGASGGGGGGRGGRGGRGARGGGGRGGRGTGRANFRQPA